jgi:hypothetical protein
MTFDEARRGCYSLLLLKFQYDEALAVHQLKCKGQFLNYIDQKKSIEGTEALHEKREFMAPKVLRGIVKRFEEETKVLLEKWRKHREDECKIYINVNDILFEGSDLFSNGYCLKFFICWLVLSNSTTILFKIEMDIWIKRSHGKLLFTFK